MNKSAFNFRNCSKKSHGKYCSFDRDKDILIMLLLTVDVLKPEVAHLGWRQKDCPPPKLTGLAEHFDGILTQKEKISDQYNSFLY